ncbi:MAG: glycosyltransferase [Bacteroidetes bacterium]|nr:glycosyltransferase [Bacteroidota bacterium]
MRILCVTSAYPTSVNTIAGNFVKAHVTALRNEGYTVDVIATNLFSVRDLFKWLKFKLNPDAEADCYFLASAINWWPFGPWFHQFWFTKTIGKAIKNYLKEKGNPDIIHAHFILWAGYASTKSAALKTIPLVVTEHSSLYFENKVTLVEMIVAGETLKQAAAVICPSEFLKNSITKNISGYESKMKLIPNIAENLFFEKYDFSLKENIIISVGRMVKTKGFDTLIDAFSKLNHAAEYKLVLVGDGVELDPLKLQVKSLGLLDRVIFTGTIDKKELVQWIRKSKIFVSCSHFETFGVAIAESMAAGTPVLVTNVGAPSGFVIPGTGEICLVGDVSDTVSKLDSMIYNYKKFDLNQIRAYALRSFNESAVAVQTGALYQKILQNL